MFIACQPKEQFSKKELENFRFYFDEIETTCNSENGQYWGTNLYGPILFIEPLSRRIAGNSIAKGLKKNETIYTGKLEESIVPGNQLYSWSGKTWNVISLPLPGDSTERANLLLNALFQKHLKQTKISDLETPECSFLNEAENKIWMRIEFEALKEALKTNDKEIQKEHVKMAVAARKMRSLYVGEYFVREELANLKHGLPVLNQLLFSQSTYKEKASQLYNEIDQIQNTSSFIKSFSSVMLPAYGLIMSTHSTDWLKTINSETRIIELVNNFFNFKYNRDFPEMLNYLKIRYRASELESLDNELLVKTNSEERKFVALFDDSPFIFIKISSKSIIETDPLFTYKYYDKGIIYKELTLRDHWGEVHVKNGAMINTQQTYIYLPAPFKIKGNSVKADGWEMKLNDGYEIAPYNNTDKFVVAKTTTQK